MLPLCYAAPFPLLFWKLIVLTIQLPCERFRVSCFFPASASASPFFLFDYKQTFKSKFGLQFSGWLRSSKTKILWVWLSPDAGHLQLLAHISLSWILAWLLTKILGSNRSCNLTSNIYFLSFKWSLSHFQFGPKLTTVTPLSMVCFYFFTYANKLLLPVSPAVRETAPTTQNV